MAEPFRGRFQREAQTIAALNHPNVCTLYDVGPNYLVMELVEGRTLAERIAKGPVMAPNSLCGGAYLHERERSRTSDARLWPLHRRLRRGIHLPRVVSCQTSNRRT